MEQSERERRLGQLKRRLLGSEEVKLVDRYMSCPVCGQFYDVQDLTEVYHHGDAPHSPMRAQA